MAFLRSSACRTAHWLRSSATTRCDPPRSPPLLLPSQALRPPPALVPVRWYWDSVAPLTRVSEFSWYVARRPPTRRATGSIAPRRRAPAASAPSRRPPNFHAPASDDAARSPASHPSVLPTNTSVGKCSRAITRDADTVPATPYTIACVAIPLYCPATTCAKAHTFIACSDGIDGLFGHAFGPPGQNPPRALSARGYSRSSAYFSPSSRIPASAIASADSTAVSVR